VQFVGRPQLRLRCCPHPQLLMALAWPSLHHRNGSPCSSAWLELVPGLGRGCCRRQRWCLLLGSCQSALCMAASSLPSKRRLGLAWSGTCLSATGACACACSRRLMGAATAGHVFETHAVALLVLTGCRCRSLSRSYRAPTAWHGPCSCCSNLDLEGLQPGMMALMHSLDELMVYGCFEVRRGGMGEAEGLTLRVPGEIKSGLLPCCCTVPVLFWSSLFAFSRACTLKPDRSPSLPWFATACPMRAGTCQRHQPRPRLPHP
jgi:hypothetical protein